MSRSDVEDTGHHHQVNDSAGPSPLSSDHYRSASSMTGILKVKRASESSAQFSNGSHFIKDSGQGPKAVGEGSESAPVSPSPASALRRSSGQGSGLLPRPPKTQALTLALPGKDGHTFAGAMAIGRSGRFSVGSSVGGPGGVMPDTGMAMMVMSIVVSGCCCPHAALLGVAGAVTCMDLIVLYFELQEPTVLVDVAT